MVESIKELRKICQRDVDLDIYSRIYRKASIYFTKLFLYTAISPNKITFVRILIGIVAGIFLAQGDGWLILFGAFLIIISDILDHSDGEVARYKHMASISGLYLDRISSAITHPYYFICLSIGLYNTSNNFIILLIGLSAAFSDSLKTIVVYCMFISAVDVKIRLRHQEMGTLKTSKKKKKVGTAELRSKLASQFSIFYHIPDILFNRALGMTPLIVMASIIDAFTDPIILHTFVLTGVSAILYLYGILGPFVWVVSATSIIRNQLCENLYDSLFRTKAENEV